MHLVRTFCSSTAKTSALTPTFCFMILVRTVLPFNEKKNWHKSMFCVLEILLKCTEWAITGRTASVQIKSSLERKVKTRAFFLINNTFKLNSVRCHMHHQKNFPFCLVLGCTRSKRVPNSRHYFSALWRENEHGDPNFLLRTFLSPLDLLHQCTKFHPQSMLGSFTKNFLGWAEE